VDALDEAQKQLDAEDNRLRLIRLDRLYDEKMELERKIAEDRRNLRENKSRLTQIDWYIQEQIRIMLGRQKINQADTVILGLPPEKKPP
jgi:hypothetical protein